jgi:hypothetical protein
MKITPCILFYHNALILELNNKTNSIKHGNNWMLNKTLLNDLCVIVEIRKKSFREANENKNTTYQNIWDTAKAIL